MEPVVITLVVLVVLALLAALFFVLQKRRKRNELRRRFGPEYDRAVRETGSTKDAEHKLAAVADRRDHLDIKELQPAERARFTEEWELVQARFVDEPAGAVDSADQLLTTVLRTRGYPVEKFDERASLVATDHPDVVEHYREAHAAHQRHRATGSADTEDLRQSFVHYRALFDALVGRQGGDHRVDLNGTQARKDAR